MGDYKLPNNEYRDQSLRPIVISVVVHDDSFDRDGVVLFVHFQTETQRYSVRLCMPGCLGVNKFDDLKEQFGRGALSLAKWMVMTGQYKDHVSTPEDQYLELFAKDATRSPGAEGIKYTLENRNFQFVNPRMESMLVQEHKLARKILLFLLYSREALSEHDMHEFSHFPEDVIRSEWAALCGSALLTPRPYQRKDMPDGKTMIINKGMTLSARGRETYETEFDPTSGIVFIVAACDAEKRPLQKDILDTYKAAVRARGLDPKFQEHEEPHKNIYVDIFDYIDACEFVIADITYQRASCYIEIGYALARQKPVLLFVEEDYFNSEEMNGKVPFDLFATKYQTYKRTELADLKEKCDERIKTVQSRRTS